MSSTVPMTDDDNRYKAVQHKLKTLSRALDSAASDLQALQRRMRVNATHTGGVADDVAHAELDTKFVEMTNQVAVALGGASVEISKLVTAAAEASSNAETTRRKHARLYGALDEIRSGRRERTPKPGFFAH